MSAFSGYIDFVMICAGIMLIINSSGLLWKVIRSKFDDSYFRYRKYALWSAFFTLDFYLYHCVYQWNPDPYWVIPFSGLYYIISDGKWLELLITVILLAVWILIGKTPSKRRIERRLMEREENISQKIEASDSAEV